MEFKLTVRPGERPSAISICYDNDLDDVRTILHNVCESLQDSTPSEFIISGFGQNRWPVAIRTDLSVFLEQLPSAINAIKSGSSFTLDFYEQGIERKIYFDLEGSAYFARCEVSEVPPVASASADPDGSSYSALSGMRRKWTPNPRVEQIERVQLQKMFCSIRDDLIKYLVQTAPSIASHPWIEDFFKD